MYRHRPENEIKTNSYIDFPSKLYKNLYTLIYFLSHSYANIIFTKMSSKKAKKESYNRRKPGHMK